MKKHQDSFALRVSVVAVRSAIVTMALLPAASIAYAQDATVADLTQRTSTVEIGINETSKDSFKFGEYNGLQKKGATLIGNVELNSRTAYDSNDATRFRLIGTDLGLDTRNLSVEYGEQGKFRLNFGYDELLRNRSDSYQTPYQGTGSNMLTLPAGWLVPQVPRVSGAAANARGLSSAVAQSNALVTGVSTPPTAAQAAASAAIITADIPAFQNVKIHTKRTAEDVGVSFQVNPRWDVAASVRHEKKDGYKLMGTVSRQNAALGLSSAVSVGDASAVIPDLIDQTTDQYNMSLNYRGDQEFLTAAYYGSIFKNDVKSMSWQNWSTGPASVGGAAIPGSRLLNTMSSAPNNTFHQFNLTGGYDFSKTTKLVMNGSYARNRQNDTFVTDVTDTAVPQSSLNGLVVTKALNMKLTAKPVAGLNLTGAYKYDNRDNRTPVNTYQYSDAQEAPVANASFAGVTAQNATANRPYSKKVNQFNFDADYALAKGQAIKAGYEWQKIDRYCNGSWIDCADAATTKENTLRAEWRTAVVENVTTKLGYAYSKRTVNAYNENAFLALVPYANVVPAGQTISAYQALLATGLNGYGPISGLNGGVFPGSGITAAQAAVFFPSNNVLPNALYANNNRISELPGMRRYNMADRNRDKLRSSINWQANEQLSFQGGLDYNKDDYANSTYGLKDAKSWVLNLDGAYAANENLTFNAYYSYEDQRSKFASNSYTANSAAANVNGFTAISGGCYATIALRNAANKIDPCLNWSSDMRDKVDTLGLSFKQKDLMAGKFELSGDLIFTRARSDNNATGGNYANNPLAVAGAPAGTIAAFFIPAANLPTVTTNTTEFRLTGKYMLDKSSAVRVGYSYARMKATDYAYDGMQFGGVAATMLPSNETAPNFTVHTIGAAYIYSFK